MRKRFSLCKKVGVFLLTAVMCTSQMCYAGIPDTKCTYPSKAELAMWIEQRAAAQMAEALKKAVPDKKEHPIRISIITLVLAYSTFFYGLWYGIKRMLRAS